MSPITTEAPVNVDAVDLLHEELQETALRPKKKASPEERRLLFALWRSRDALRSLRRRHGQCQCESCHAARRINDSLQAVCDEFAGALRGVDQLEEVYRDIQKARRARRGDKDRLVWVLCRVGEGAVTSDPVRHRLEREARLMQRHKRGGGHLYLCAVPKRFYDLHEERPWWPFDPSFASVFEEL